MKKFVKVFVPILLAIVIVFGVYWYLFEYDREFTRDMLLQAARYCESRGDMEKATWFYDLAYQHSNGSDEIAIEVANQYIESGNYTQAEVALNRAIKDGGGVNVYIALCKTYVAQDKLLDAVDLLDNISDPLIKNELDRLRPQLPGTQQAPGFYNQYISVTLESNNNTLYVSSNGQYPSTMTDLYREPITLHDGENVLYAIAVAENGLVSPMAIFGYTVGGVVEEVVFSDPVIETVIRDTLLVSDTKVLYSNDLWGITEFTVPDGATNYSDLRHLAYLKSLTIENGISGQLSSLLIHFSVLDTLIIRNTMITSEELTLIGSVSTLKNLTMSNCGVSNISGLSALTGLQKLDLCNNAVRNIAPIAQLPNLTELYLSSNALQDLSAISTCTSLNVLDISYNSVSDLSPLRALLNLKILNIGHNTISDSSALGDIKSLTEIRADNNQIVDISTLSNCTALEYLDISYNAVTDISPIVATDSITYLNFSNNNVSKLPTWSASSSLVTIDGSYNSISDLSGLAKLRKLNNVFMDYNAKISSVDVLAGCPMLIQVNVYGTKVKDVSSLTEQSIIVNYNPIQ